MDTESWDENQTTIPVGSRVVDVLKIESSWQCSSRDAGIEPVRIFDSSGFREGQTVRDYLACRSWDWPHKGMFVGLIEFWIRILYGTKNRSIA